MVSITAYVARAKEGAIGFYAAILLIWHQQKRSLKDVRVMSCDVKPILIKKQSTRHDDLVKAAPEILMFVGADIVLVYKMVHQIEECVLYVTRAISSGAKMLFHAFVRGIIIEIAHQQDIGGRIV